MPRSSLISRPSKPMLPRMTSSVTRLEMLAGASASIGGEHDMRRHRRGQSGKSRNGTKSEASSSSRVAVTTGRSKWLSAMARPCPGMCLMTGSTPPGHQAFRHRRAQRSHILRRRRIGPIADDAVAAGSRHVEQRGAVGVDADGAQVGGRQPGRRARRSRRPLQVAAVAPRHRPQPRAAPANAGGLSRCTRPPSWSMRTRISSPTAARAASVRRRSWSGSTALRANRMTPHGRAARSTAASRAASSGPPGR